MAVAGMAVAANSGRAMTHATPYSALHGNPAALMAEGQQFCLVVASPRLVPSQTSGVSAQESRLCPQPRVQQALPVASSAPERGGKESIVRERGKVHRQMQLGSSTRVETASLLDNSAPHPCTGRGWLLLPRL